MKRLILHVGFMKTGSSALQSWFANNIQGLNSQSLNYAGENELALDYKTSSGNAELLIHWLRNGVCDGSDIIDFYFGKYNQAVISGELLQDLFDDEIDKLQLLVKQHNIKLKVVAFIRNVYDFHYSIYVQHVKRRGTLLSFEDWVEKKEVELLQCRYYFRFLKTFDVRLIYYDDYVVKADVARAFSKCAGINYDAIEINKLPKKNVNRTLSLAEIRTIQQFVALGLSIGLNPVDFSKVLSDKLVDDGMNANNRMPSLDKKTFELLNDLYSEELSEFNMHALNRFGFKISILSNTEYADYREPTHWEVRLATDRLVDVIINDESLTEESKDLLFDLLLKKGLRISHKLRYFLYNRIIRKYFFRE